MSSLKKEHAKQLKAPDPIQARLAAALTWILRNSRLGLFVLVPLVIAGGAFYAWQYYQTDQRHDRVEELGKIQVVYEGELRKASEAREAITAKIDALDAKTAAAPAPTADGKPADAAAPMDLKAVVEKAALTKQADAIKPDHTESRRQFQEFAKRYEATPEGWHAGMVAARLLIDDEKKAEALPLLQTVLEKSKDKPFYQIQVRFALVGLYEDAGDFDKALAETEALEKLVDADLQPKVLLARGRIQMLKDAKDEAKKTFAVLIEKHGSSPEAQKARSMQALLN